MKTQKGLLTNLTIIILISVSGIQIGCKKDNGNTPENESSISNFVGVGVSRGEPSFSFPEESGGPYSSVYSDINYNFLGKVVSYHATITFNSSGNIYSIQVSSISRNSSGSTTSFTASITATINGKTISGILNYPWHLN